MKCIYRVTAICMVVFLTLMSSVAVAAQSNVTYDGNSQKFIFAVDSQESPTDLFANFKNVMPGDHLTQTVRIKNDVKNNTKIMLYLKSTGATPESVDFLSKLTLDVKQDGNTNLYSGPADQTGTLGDWVYLGTFYSGAEVDLTITCHVPIELSDDFQDAVGHLGWQFKVEELPVEPGDPQAPQTGERLRLLAYGSLAVVIVCAAVVWMMLNKRKAEK